MDTVSLNRVAVVSSAQTQLRESWNRLQHVDLISRAVSGALKGSGLRIQDIDFVVDCGSDVLDGRSISNCGFLGALGAHHKEEARVEEDGLFGLIYAATKVAAGSAQAVLLVAYSKPSESSVADYYATLTEPFYQRGIGVNHVVAAGLMANQYVTRYDIADETLARVAARAWQRADANSNVEVLSVPTLSDIMSAPFVADPLRLYELARPVDGAVAIVIATEEVARRVTTNPVWITGMGSSMDSHFLADRAPAELEACRVATTMALRRAGLSIDSIGLAEFSASSAATEAMVVEALGFAKPGEGAKVYLADGDVEFNPSGGSIPADPIMATGAVRLHEAASRLAGRIGSTQATKALVHGAGGIGMQNHCVVTLEVSS